MSSDYKYDMQMIAEELAEDEYGTDFYSLSDELQYQVFNRAMGKWTDDRFSEADHLRKEEREGGQ